MILGNLQSSSYRRIATYTNSDSFCQFTVQLLKTVLCISRKEYISLKANDRLSRPEKFVSEHVLSVTEGSSLSLIFFDCPKYCKDIDLDCSDTEFRKKDSSSNICVRIVSDSESTNVPAESVHKLDTPIIRLVLMDEVELNADIQHRSNVCRRVLRIEAVSVGCGIIGISVPAFLNENSKTADVVVFLKIYVVPRVPVENTMAHELLGLLECVPNFPNSLEHARCVMRAQCMSRLDITYENLEQVSLLFFVNLLIFVS